MTLQKKTRVPGFVSYALVDAGLTKLGALEGSEIGVTYNEMTKRLH